MQTRTRTTESSPRAHRTHPGRRARRHRPVLALAAATALGLGALAGCSGAGHPSSASTASSSGGGSAVAPEIGTADGAAAAPRQASASAAGGSAVTPGGVQQGRAALHPQALVVTVGRTIRVRDVAQAVRAAASLATGSGGHLEGEDGQEDPENSGKASERIVLRVPPARVEAVVAGIEREGTVLARTRTEQDVTQQVQDVDARLANARASVARVRAFYSQAKGVRDVVLMEGELSRRVADLESLEGQYAALTDSTSLATVTVTFQGTAVLVPRKETTGFTAGLRAGRDALAASLVVLLTVLGGALPFVPVVLVLVLLAWGALRLARRRNATTVMPRQSPG